MNYITLKDMGSSGGLCSQLSIFAGLLAVARANKLKIAFSQEMIDGDEVIYPPTNELFRNSIRIFDLLDLEYELKPNSFFDNLFYYLDEFAPNRKVTKKEYKLMLKPWIS